MALFKILQGESSRISLDVTPFHNGWCYYTSDDGKFYIDSDDGGTQNRTCINEVIAARVIKASLKADGWSGNQQTLAVDEITASQNGIVSVDGTISGEQLSALTNAGLYVSNQANKSLTISAAGTVPTVDIPIAIFLFSALVSAAGGTSDGVASTSYVDSVVGDVGAVLDKINGGIPQ